MESSTSEQPGVNEWISRSYDRLHEVAKRRMGRERASHTLSATSLINEVFIRLRKRESLRVNDEFQFLAIASREMSRILIDFARKKRAVKRDRNKSPMLNQDPQVDDAADTVLEIHEAIDALEKECVEKAELVRLRYILGFSEVEAAQVLQISRATASRHWNYARAWLTVYLSK